MKESSIQQIVRDFKNSPYFIGAVGCRGLERNELFEVIRIIRSNKISKIGEKLYILHKYNPATIALDRYCREDCINFCDLCDCFLPDVKFEDCFCQRNRKKELEETDKRNYPEYNEWREKIFKRDNYTCQKCGIRGGELQAHHIKPYKDYPKLRLDIDNGITYCLSCHKSEHYD